MVHDESSRTRGRFELRQLQHRGAIPFSPQEARHCGFDYPD